MIIVAENRKVINGEYHIHDACFYSFESKYEKGQYSYTLKAFNEWSPEEEFIFIFSGVSSCIYTGENSPQVLGGSVNCWYSLPCYPYGSLASDTLTKSEIEELNQHGADKQHNIRKDIRFWEHEYNILPKCREKLFKIVFFLSTPAFLEIECEKLVIEKGRR